MSDGKYVIRLITIVGKCNLSQRVTVSPRNIWRESSLTMTPWQGSKSESDMQQPPMIRLSCRNCRLFQSVTQKSQENVDEFPLRQGLTKDWIILSQDMYVSAGEASQKASKFMKSIDRCKSTCQWSVPFALIYLSVSNWSQLPKIRFAPSFPQYLGEALHYKVELEDHVTMCEHRDKWLTDDHVVIGYVRIHYAMSQRLNIDEEWIETLSPTKRS